MEEVVFEVYQRESLQLVLTTEPVLSYENKYINLIVKEYNDTSEDNQLAIINKTILMNSTNLSSEDLINVRNGIIKISINNTETNVVPTEYKFMIQETNSENSVASVLLAGKLIIRDNYLKIE